MLSMLLFRVIVDERERSVQEDLRIRRLLQPPARIDGAPAAGAPVAAYRESWRARTPRASATTR